MTLIHFQVDRTILAIECPDMLRGVIATCWPHAIVDEADTPPVATITIREVGPNQWTLQNGAAEPIGPVEKAGFVLELTGLVHEILEEAGIATPIAAGCVSWDQGNVLVFGGVGSGKSTLLAWLVSNGFGMQADQVLFFAQDGTRASGLGGPFVMPSEEAIKTLCRLPEFGDCLRLKGPEQHVLLSNPEWVLPENESAPSFLIFVDHQRGGGFSVAPLSGADLAAKIANLHQDWPEPRLTALQEYLKDTPAITLSYSAFDEIENLLDQLCFHVISVGPAPAVFESYLGRMTGTPAASNQVRPIPARTERKLTPRLTIGMATFDDYDGVYFSLQAIRLYHPEILDEVEFVVVDNNPEGLCAEPLKRLEANIPNYRYIPATGIKGTAVRDYIFREAFGDYVLSMDCHVFFVPGALRRLLDYYAANPDTSDLLQGPLLMDDLETVSTHFVPEWRMGMYGRWSDSEKQLDLNAEPFEIPNQGLGIFSCRKDAWPGFNPAFRGFGGEEGYLHQKFRNRGDRAMCLPFLQWMHRFERPFGVRYPNNWEDRIRNYAIGWEEVGLPIDEMRAHFTEQTNQQVVDKVFETLAAERPMHFRRQAK